MNDYKEDIKINEHDLEQEWIEHPSLFLHYAEAHADAVHNRDLAKAKADYVYAIMYSKIKKDWEKFFDSKPTEPAIKEYIASHSKFKKAERAFFDASKDMNLMLSVKMAFDHRKRALENLVSLRISGFHAEPRNKVKDFNNKGGHKQRQQALNEKENRRKGTVPHKPKTTRKRRRK